MCLDNIEEIAAAVEAAKKAKAESVEFERRIAEAIAEGKALLEVQSVTLTTDELRLIMARRIEQAEQALKDLGFRGPLAKAAPADAAETTRVLNAR